MAENSLPRELIFASALRTTYAGADIPMFSVVSHFFLMATAVSVPDHASAQDTTLREIGIEHGSELVGFFIKLTDEARQLLESNTVDVSLKGEAFYRHQYAMLRQKAARLAGIYRTLLNGFADAGVSTEKLEAFLETKIRATTRIYSSEPDDTPYFDAVREFDRELGRP